MLPPEQSAQSPEGLEVQTPSSFQRFKPHVEQLGVFGPLMPPSGGLSASATPDNANTRQRTAIVSLRIGHLYQRSDGRLTFHTPTCQGPLPLLVCFRRPCATSGPSWRCCGASSSSTTPTGRRWRRSSRCCA